MPFIYLINFLLAISATIGMTILPFLVTESLGLSLLFFSFMEGTAELLSNLLRLVNGVLFDRVKNKKHLFLFSTMLAFFSKALLLFPNTVTILSSKILERLSNGAFASPRDAYVAEKSTHKGKSLGILGITKTAGCILGPLLVSLSTLILGGLKENLNFFVFFSCALLFPTILFSLFLKFPDTRASSFSLKGFRGVFKKLLPFLGVVFLFFLGRFNDGILIIHLKQQGFPEWFYLSTIGIFNAIMLISSLFIGKNIDNGKLNKMLYLTIFSLIGFNISFYLISGLSFISAILGLIFWGIQRTGAQIVFSSFVFSVVPKENYGTGIGLYYLVSGTASFIAAMLAGLIAKNHLSSIFLLSGFFSLASLIFVKSLKKFAIN